ncbi:hypothetical protein CRM22_003895 [Opisthorchis felineus]|uniref:Protein SMG9 n=1 Tax=Opisthorchis felineus TaxID=147828 RepID=A0A4S2LZ30_OPIFE|nr:hypothetical protein CRM22_003895 [Opisthorchis felineus]
MNSSCDFENGTADQKSAPVKSILDFFSNPLEPTELIDAENDVDELYALCDDPMQIPVKLVDDQFRFADLSSIQDLFVENSGFLVVSAIGMQSTGKSSLLNVLGNQLTPDTGLIDGPFAVQSMKNLVTNSPQTGGIDLYITQDRIILLDAQPLLSFALTNYHSQSSTAQRSDRVDIAPLSLGDSASSTCTLFGPGNWSLDVWPEMASLQIITFLLNVCHVLLVVTDNLSTAPSQLYRLIDRAAALKPTVYTPSVLPHSAFATVLSRTNRRGSGLPSGIATKHQNARHQVQTSKLTNAAGSDVLQGDVELNGAYQQAQSEEDDEADDTVGEQPRSAGVGSDGLPASVGPTGLLHTRSQDAGQPLESESGDVVDALNRLKTLTDYSASLIHVYNQAPAAAFLDPVVRQRLKMFRQQLLPMLFPGYRRLAALIGVGPQILSAHLASRSRNQVPVATLQTTEENVRQPLMSSGELKVGEGHVICTDVGESCGAIDVRNPSICLSASEPSIGGIGMREDGHLASSLQLSSAQELHSGQTPLGSEVAADERLSDKAVLADSSPLTDELAPQISELQEQPSVEGHSHAPQDQESRLLQSQSSVATGLDTPAQPTSGDPAVVAITESQGGHRPIPFCPVNTGSSSSAAQPPLSDAKEADVAAECYPILQAVEAELSGLLARVPRLATESPSSPHLPTGVSELYGASADHPNLWDGERQNAEMANMTHQVQSVRRRFFNIQRRLDHPRMFLIPVVDEEGNSPVGCPTYSASVKSLQEAILSTPRQHMMPKLTEKKWILYAQKMWETVLTSPILSDYHAVLST